MPTDVEIPGVGVVEFPDGMTNDQIAAAIRTNILKSAPQVGADLPNLPARATEVEPEGSWLVRGLGKVASAMSQGEDEPREKPHPLSPAGFAHAAMTGVPQQITEATGKKYTSLPERIDTGFNAPGGLRDVATKVIDTVGGRGTTEQLKRNLPAIPAIGDVTEEGLKFLSGLAEFQSSPVGVALPLAGKTGQMMRQAAKTAQAAGAPEAASLALKAKIAEQAGIGAGAAFGADMTQAAVEPVRQAIEDPTVKNVAEAGFAVAGAGLPLIHAAAENSKTKAMESENKATATEKATKATEKNPESGALSIPNPFTPTETLTPEQQWADTYAKTKIAEREAARGGRTKRALDAFQQTVAKAKTEGLDSLSPILDATAAAQKEHKFEILPTSRFEYYADRSLGSHEASERFMESNGLLDVIKSPDKMDRFDQFLIAKEAVREAAAQGRETGRDLESDARYVEAWKDVPADTRSGGVTYDQLSEKFYEYGNSLLDYSVDAGLVSKNAAEQWKLEYGGEHVPLARVFEAIDRAAPESAKPNRQVAHLSKQTVYAKRKGSARQIDNPMFEMMERTRAAFSQGERNRAARTLASYSELPGLNELIRDATRDKEVPKNSFSYLEDGSRRVFETTPEFAAAAKTLDAQTLGIAAKIVGYPARLTRFFTTDVRPAFAAANLPVDLMTTLITSKNAKQTTLNPAVWWEAFKAGVLHGEEWGKIEAHGAGFTQLDLYRNTREHTLDAIRASRSGKDWGKYVASHPIRSSVDVFRAMEDVISRSEQFGRARNYIGTKKAELAKGHTLEDAEILAAIASNNELPNYRRSGNVTRAFNGMILYLNAGLQGARITARAIKDRPIETASKIAVGLYLPVALTTYYNLSDPERKKIYDDIRKYEKDNNLIIVTPGAHLNPKTNKYEGIVKVKLAPGLSSLTVPVRRVIEAQYGADPVTFQEVATKLVGAVSPVEPTVNGMAAGLTPQIVKPGVQAYTNKDFFRGSPKLPRRLENLPPEQQVMPNTSGTIRKAASAAGISPVMAEEFIKDTIGGAAPELINAVDSAAASMGAIPQDEVGGQNVAQSITARFEEARGGEVDQRIYDALAALREKAVNQAVGKLKQDPNYIAIKDKNQRLDIERKMASSVTAKLNAMTSSHKAWDEATTEQKMEAITSLDRMVGGKPVFRGGERVSP